MDKRPIGIFDSGVGGLTVVKQVMTKLPNEQIIYFGDTARLPYGSKSKETVTKFSRQIIHFLLTKNVKAIIIACNTASSNSLDILKQEFNIPLFGVVKPGVEEAIKITKNKKIGVIGTAATIRSGAYKRFIHNIDSGIQVFSKSCPLFVPLVEEGWTENRIADLTAKKYLKEMIDEGIDSIVLGCTHYPLMRNCIKKVVGECIELVDPAYGTAMAVREFLEEHNQISMEGYHKEHDFYVSDTTDNFQFICRKALNHTFEPIIIDIEKY